jgi:hypothetical protein
MELAALHDRVVEHVADRAAPRLGTVDHHQDGPGDLQPAVAQPGQQVADDLGVLGRALGQSEGDLGPIDGDAEGDHTAMLGHPDASTPRPVPTARASKPSRAAPASSARAIVTRSGRTSSGSADTVGRVCLGM